MKDYYLKFASQSEAESVLYASEQVGDETITIRQFANIDVVGVISRPTGAVDAEGNPVTAPIDGWHVNVRVVDGEDEAAILPYAVTPTQPIRVWW